MKKLTLTAALLAALAMTASGNRPPGATASADPQTGEPSPPARTCTGA